jgi:hypothetical protein
MDIQSLMLPFVIDDGGDDGGGIIVLMVCGYG